MYKNGIWVKTRKDYEREFIILDEELSEIQMKMEKLREEYIAKYGIFEWNELSECLRHTV